jgi:hypothetical protein
MNHFKCYKVRSKGSGFVPLTVTVADQFETKMTRVLKPLLLCNPVDKNGEGIPDPACHLTCYRIRDAPGQLPFTPDPSNGRADGPPVSEVTSIITKVLYYPPRPLASVLPGVPPELAMVIMRCMMKDPAQRFPNAVELGTALLLVEQSPPLIADVVDRVYVLERGWTTIEGTVDDIGGADGLAAVYLGAH